MDQNSPPLEFGRAKPSEAPQIQRLYLQLVNDPNINVTESSLRRIENDPTNFLVVGRLRERVVATALFTICQDVMYETQPFAVVENIIIDSELRKRGYGLALMIHLKHLGKENRCTKVMLLSSAKRPEAHLFFERCGYRGDLKKGFVNYINR